MEVVAISKSVRISPRKARLVAESIKKLSAMDAVNSLTLIKKRGAYAISKTLKSAIYNAVNNAKAKQESLFIKGIEISEGSALKRFHPSTRGRVHPYKKRSSHIKVVLQTKEV